MDVIEKVISGVCIGSDIAGVRAAKRLGIPTGGWNWSKSPMPEYNVRGMEEHPFMEHDRTAANVLEAHVTIHIATESERVTLYPLAKFRKPFYEVRVYKHDGKWVVAEDAVYDLCEWLIMARMFFGHPLIINIAGDAKPAMEPLVEQFLTEVLTTLWEPAMVTTS